METVLHSTNVPAFGGDVAQRCAVASEPEAVPVATPEQAADVFVDATSSPPYSTASDTSQVPKLRHNLLTKQMRSSKSGSQLRWACESGAIVCAQTACTCGRWSCYTLGCCDCDSPA
jgi:hypothetical protein